MGSLRRTTEHVPMTDSKGHRVLVVKVRTFRGQISEWGSAQELETSQMHSLANGARVEAVSGTDFKILRTGEVLKLVVTQSIS